jgi:membrane protein CcdC involved in cytochrome C biogenesis
MVLYSHMKRAILLSLLLLPNLLLAQGLQSYIPSFINFVSSAVIPFLLGIAFLVVIYNTVRYFILESPSSEGREKAKSYLLYSILAFVIIIVFWGIVNLIAGSTGIGGCRTPSPDYLRLDFVGPPDPLC